ncbi:MAG: glycerophosphodiester phosphodiesterase family protein [Pseudomonadales bacterium]|jgi:glycerophosphoryl diester phosphodiesterase|nr:glycerophosphodiester phosphodiesterase family protein [Pseudomonadales bacterium]MDP6471741.1 glycerophosphodiester phosphodiesterase family protein [Pseudomonadales bacterium]MDP6971427.1 glycerophosphodiester phosphodiesterase family protein [Pseudomonadales bacterium]|tara:strand:+ start:2636 stop:3343 length:708 start_codon:yes stop_codon:yes gene_type:complete
MAFDAHPLVIGHRGAVALAPENTLASFHAAISLGVHAVELDVQWHAGELWVIHDDTLERTTNGVGPLTGLSRDELLLLDAGDGERIPRLQQVLDSLPVSVGVNIELKGQATAEPVARALTDTRGRDVLVSSFDHGELHRFFELAQPGIRLSPLFYKWQDDVWQIARDFNAWSVNLSERLATAARVEAALSHGLKVLVYTVNNLSKARKLVRHGVAGVFTDRPDVITPTALGDRSP